MSITPRWIKFDVLYISRSRFCRLLNFREIKSPSLQLYRSYAAIRTLRKRGSAVKGNADAEVEALLSKQVRSRWLPQVVATAAVPSSVLAHTPSHMSLDLLFLYIHLWPHLSYADLRIIDFHWMCRKKRRDIPVLLDCIWVCDSYDRYAL